MIEMKDKLFAAPIYAWQQVPITDNHHKWLLQWYRSNDNGNFFFSFVSPKKRRYSFHTELGKNGTKITNAEVILANGKSIASYVESWGDSPTRLDAVLRLAPNHILSRLSVLLDAIEL